MQWRKEKWLFENGLAGSTRSAQLSAKCPWFHWLLQQLCQQDSRSCSLLRRKAQPSRDSPNRDNISYAVQVITPDPAQTFKTLVQELKEHKELTERTIIYCQTIKVTTFLYSFFMSELGADMYFGNSGDPKKRTVKCLTAELMTLIEIIFWSQWVNQMPQSVSW